MNINSIIVGAIAGIVTGGITAYITTLLRMKEERKKWLRDFALQYAEKQASDVNAALRMAEQFAIGFLIHHDPNSGERTRYFIPQNCRVTAGRNLENTIVISDSSVSSHHCIFYADSDNIYVTDLGSLSGTEIKKTKEEHYDSISSQETVKLSTNDLIKLGQVELIFHKLKIKNNFIVNRK